MSIKAKLMAAAIAASTSAAVFAQTTTTENGPLKIISDNKDKFLDDNREVLYAGAGLVIGALLVKTLVNMVIKFFQRG